MPARNKPMPLGQALIHHSLPKGYEFPTDVVDKSAMYSALRDLAKDDSPEYVDTVRKLRDVGNYVATYEGLSLGLDDIRPDYKRRDPIIQGALAEVKQTNDPSKRGRIIRETQDKILKLTASHPGQMTLQAKSGGRGNFAQLMRTVASPVGADSDGSGTDPWLITHSFSEGLSPSEWWIANAEARLKSAESFSLVTEPGEMHKLVNNTMGDQVVTELDCGTKNGVEEPTDSPQVINRALARSYPGFPKDTMVTSKVTSALKKNNKTLLVRSPMTCESKDGVCQRCYGWNFRGNHPEIGTNVGLIGAQALAEPLQQGAMSAKHAGGTLSEASLDLKGFSGFQTFLEVPKKFPNAATLSLENGRVSSIDRAPQGGHFVVVNTKQHYIPPNLKPTVKVGDRVEAGDALSNGVPKPNEVVKHKGIGEGRKYYADKIHDLFSKDFHKGLDKRHVELLAKSHLSSVEVVHDPKKGLLRGDVVNYNRLKDRLEDGAKTIPVSNSIGHVLAESVGGHMAGTRINSRVKADLARNGVKDVLVADNPPEVDFVMRPIQFAPLANPDWIARLGHSYLKDSIVDAAVEGHESNIHSTNPASAFIYGREFGLGPDGKY